METLLAELKAIDTRIDEADASLDKLLSGGALSAEQKAEHDKLVADRESAVAERGKVQAKIAKEKERQAREDERVRLEEEEADRKSKIDQAKIDAERAKRRGGSRLTDSDAGGLLKGGKVQIPNAVRRSTYIPKNFIQGTLEERRERAYRFGMFGLALLSMNLGGGYRNRDAEDFVEAEMTVHQSNNSTGAHVLIPEEFSTEMIVLREQYGVARRLLRQERMNSDTKVVPRRQSGLTAYFVGEGSAGTESNKKWNNVRLVAKDVMVLSRWSAQVDADAVINFGDDLAKEITYAYSQKEDDCAFNGDGTSTYGGITGIRTLMGSAGIATQGTSNTWAALVLADFHNVVGKLPQYADTPAAVWVCHRTFYYGVIQKLELAAGGVTAMEIANGDRRPRPLFLGYPVEFSQTFPSTTAVATIPIILGDLALAAMLGDRQQEGIAFSNEATIGGESLFERNQIAIRGVERIDINVHDVGDSSNAGPVVALKTGA